MALTKAEKGDVIAEVAALLADSKMTVVAKFQGTTVKALQQLRRDARANGTKVKVVKNRLVIQALKANESLKDVDVSALEGMLLYAFNSEDEVAAAQVLNTFAKTNPTLEFVGAVSGEGVFVSAADVKALAGLPSKNQLIAQVVAQLLSPVHDVTNALSGNLHALLDGVEAKATAKTMGELGTFAAGEPNQTPMQKQYALAFELGRIAQEAMRHEDFENSTRMRELSMTAMNKARELNPLLNS